MVRPRAARAHPPLHGDAAARRDRAGQPGRLHALPLQVAARRSGRSADRSRRPARSDRHARRLRARRRRMGTIGAAGARRRLRRVDARHAVPRGRGRVGTACRRPPPTLPDPPRLAPATPIALFLREHADAWLALRAAGAEREARLGRQRPRACSRRLRERGASFFGDLRQALGTGRRRGAQRRRIARRGRPGGVGRILRTARADLERAGTAGHARSPRQLRRSMERDSGGRAPARAIAMRPSRRRRGRCCAATAWCSAACSRARRWPRRGATWRASAGGSKRAAKSAAAGSSSGMSGEQFALPRAVERLREVRRTRRRRAAARDQRRRSANLAGIVTAGERVRAAARTHLVYQDGVADRRTATAGAAAVAAPTDPAIAAHMSARSRG